jgi:hypothetical protein
MKRFGLILTLFFIAFLFTQCSDDCYGGGCCGGSSGPAKEIMGMTGFYTEFYGDSASPTLLISADYTYASSNAPFYFINSAVACTPLIPISDFGPWVDSIKVNSTPSYNPTPLEKQIEITNTDYKKFLLSDFNEFLERDLNVESYGSETLKLIEKPTQSDSFTFSFYYYKDGAIIDSSFTQKFYISNE